MASFDYAARAEDAAECLRLRGIAPMAAGPRLRLAEPGYDEDGHPLADGDQTTERLRRRIAELEAQVRGLVAGKTSQGRRREARIEETTPAPALKVPSL